jgi:hypothetical protein
MAASHRTVVEIYRVIRRHVSDEQMQKIIDDLLLVEGNESFRETIRRLCLEHDKMRS